MLLYPVLIVLGGLLALASLIALVIGIIKKRRSLLLLAVSFFFISILGVGFSVIVYSKKVVDYVRSDGFQTDVKNSAELAGQTVGSISSGVSQGVASTLDDDAMAALAKKSASILGKSVKAVASGFDSASASKNIFIDERLGEAGFEFGHAETHFDNNKNQLRLFINYKQDFDGKLKLTNYDQRGKKIDVAEKSVDVKAGTEQVEVFEFSYSDLGLSTYFILSKGA